MLSKSLPTVSIRHSKIVEDYVAIKEIQSRYWQYLIESLISRVENDDQEFRLKTNEDSSFLKKMGKKYRAARSVYDSTFQSVAVDFLPYVNSLDFREPNIRNEIN